MFQGLKKLFGGEDYPTLRKKILAGGDVTSGQFDLEPFLEDLRKDEELLRHVIRAFLDRGNLKEAQRFLALTGEAKKKPEWYRLLNAELAQKSGRLGKKTLQEFLELAAEDKLKPEQVKHLYKLILSLGASSLHEIKMLMKANDTLPAKDETIELFLAGWHEKKKRFGRESLRFFQFAAATHPGDPRWLYAIVRSHQNAGEAEQARNGLHQLLSRFPGFPDARLLAQELDRDTPPAAPAAPAASPAASPAGPPGAPKGFPPRYTQFTELGRGGNGIVYRAFDQNLQRLVSIKTPRPGDISVEDRQRFVREAQIMASLKHPAILGVFDLSITEPFYICSEYVEGKSLCEIIAMKQKNQVLLTRQHAVFILKLLRGVALGFDFACRKGILHRDIKPDNILIDKTGRALIIDFGLAIGETSTRLTRTDIVMGTPWYLAPERLSGADATVRSEIYAFGVMLHEALVGSLPYKGNNVACVFAQDPIPVRQAYADLPEELELLLLECLCKNPDNRPESFAQVARTMEEIAAGMTKE